MAFCAGKDAAGGEAALAMTEKTKDPPKRADTRSASIKFKIYLPNKKLFASVNILLLLSN